MPPRRTGFQIRCVAKNSFRQGQEPRVASEIKRGSRFIPIRNPADGLAFIRAKAGPQRHHWSGRSTTVILVSRNGQRHGTIAMRSRCGGDERVVPLAASRATGRAAAGEERVYSYEFLDASCRTDASAIARSYGLDTCGSVLANGHECKAGDGGRMRRADKEAIRRTHSAAGDPANLPNSNCTCVEVVDLVRLFGELATRRTLCPGGAALIPAMLTFLALRY
jgi:hypothetical protein